MVTLTSELFLLIAIAVAEVPTPNLLAILNVVNDVPHPYFTSQG